MKIGEFAKKFGINASTVRFYIDKAIITPKRVNSLYIFDETCEKQMKRIMRYKQCKFSLEEIELLCYYERAGKLKDETVNQEYLKLFDDKKQQIEEEITENKKIVKILDEEISAYQERIEQKKETRRINIPVEALNILCCPVCGKWMPLHNADISEDGIVKGDIQCECGYSAVIADGMIICGGSSRETPFKVFENIESILALTDDFSPAYRNIMDKAHLWMYQSIVSNTGTMRNVMAGPFSYNFLPKYIDELPDEPLYIVVDVSVKKLEKLQTYFSDTDKKILFIAGEIGKLPIKKESIDLYIDDFCSTNYTFTYSRNLLESVAPLLKNGGMLVGQFNDYSMAPKSLENFRKDHTEFDPELMRVNKMHEAFRRAGIKIIEENNCGATAGTKKDFARHVVGEPISVISYRAHARHDGK